MAWAPLIGTMDTPSASRSRPDRLAASVKASSSVTPSTKTIVPTPGILPRPAFPALSIALRQVDPNQLVSASRNPRPVLPPTQAPQPSGLISTATDALTLPRMGDSHAQPYLAF